MVERPDRVQRTAGGTDASNRRRFLKVAGGGALVGLAGCLGGGGGGGDDTETDSGNGGGGGGGGGGGTTDGGDDSVELPDTLRIGHPSPARPVYNLPTYTTFLDRMEERGVTLEPQTFSGFTGVVAGMVSGEVDLAYTTPPSLVNATSQGFPIKSVMELSQRFSQQVIVQEEVNDWEQLRGETLVAHSPQSFSALVLKTAVRQNLGSADEVNYRYIIGTPNRIAAMESGDTLATTVFTSGAISAQNRGIAKIFYNLNDDTDPMTLAQWTLLEDQINEREEMYQVIFDEMQAAYNDVYGGDSAELADSALNSPTNFPDFGADVWADTIDIAKEDQMFPQEKSSQLTEAKIQLALELSQQTELISEIPDTSQLVDRRFLE